MSNFKILVIDDDPIIFDLIATFLEAQKYELSYASDGERGLIQTIKTRPDLVILDIEMPKMRGWEVCKLLKHNKLTQCIPVLILTSRNDISDVMMAMQHGADDYVSKPFEKDELLSRVERLLKKERGQ